jgi:hypothetical protein
MQITSALAGIFSKLLFRYFCSNNSKNIFFSLFQQKTFLFFFGGGLFLILKITNKSLFKCSKYFVEILTTTTKINRFCSNLTKKNLKTFLNNNKIRKKIGKKMEKNWEKKSIFPPDKYTLTPLAGWKR